MIVLLVYSHNYCSMMLCLSSLSLMTPTEICPLVSAEMLIICSLNFSHSNMQSASFRLHLHLL